jgi:predicted aspartyl protease
MKYWQRTINLSLKSIIAGLILLHTLIASPSFAQKFTFDGNQKKEAMDFTFIKNLIVVPIYINEKGPFNFILDTGVGSMVVTDPSLLDTLNLKNLRTTKIFGLGQGQEIEAFLSNDINVRIKSAHIEKIPTAILKQDIFDLSSYLGQKIYGLIGFNFFDSFVVKINYVSNRLNYSLPSANLRKKGEKIPLIIEKNRPYVFADIETSDKQKVNVKLIVDCGASHALSMDALNGKAWPLPKDTISANLGVGLSGVISGSMGRVPLLKLGKFTFKNVLSGFPAFEALASKIGYNQRNGNLGAEVLKRFTVTFDYPNQAMYLSPNTDFIIPFEHDMSGIEVFSDLKNSKHIFIGRIEKDSPAEKAGFMVHDEIMSLNLKLIQDYTLEEVSKLLKSQDGRTVLIEIVRDKKNIIKLLKLKRRI